MICLNCSQSPATSPFTQHNKETSKGVNTFWTVTNEWIVDAFYYSLSHYLCLSSLFWTNPEKSFEETVKTENEFATCYCDHCGPLCDKCCKAIHSHRALNFHQIRTISLFFSIFYSSVYCFLFFFLFILSFFSLFATNRWTTCVHIGREPSTAEIGATASEREQRFAESFCGSRRQNRSVRSGNIFAKNWHEGMQTNKCVPEIKHNTTIRVFYLPCWT